MVQEERRQRSESQPLGRLIEQSVSTAFVAHPYKQPVVGYMSDLQSFTATDAEEFYRRHYVPANMVTTLVGHVDPEQVIPLVEKYFGRVPAGPEPPPLGTVEPPQIAESSRSSAQARPDMVFWVCIGGSPTSGGGALRPESCALNRRACMKKGPAGRSGAFSVALPVRAVLRS